MLGSTARRHVPVPPYVEDLSLPLINTLQVTCQSLSVITRRCRRVNLRVALLSVFTEVVRRQAVRHITRPTVTSLTTSPHRAVHPSVLAHRSARWTVMTPMIGPRPRGKFDVELRTQRPATSICRVSWWARRNVLQPLRQWLPDDVRLPHTTYDESSPP